MKKTYEEFCTYVGENILSRMSKAGKRSAEITEVGKNNGIVLKAITIRRADHSVAPNLYLHDFYEKYAVGQATLEEVLCEIAETYTEEEQQCPAFDVSILQEARIIGCLVGTVDNKDLLNTVPFVAVGNDLAIIFKYYIGKQRNTAATITITDSLAQHFGYDKSSLLYLALKNTLRLFPMSIQSLENALFHWAEEEGLPFPEPDSANPFPFYVLSNTADFNGAFALFYDGALETLFDILGERLLLLPCSINEWIVLPSDGKEDLFRFAQMVLDANKTLPKEEILGYHAYVVEKGKGSIFQQLSTTCNYCRLD